MNHSKVINNLYDFLTGGLDAATQHDVESHLALCESCRKERDEIAAMLKQFASTAVDASSKLPDSYWNSFATGVEQRIVAEQRAGVKKRTVFSIGNMLDHMFFTPRPYLTAFGGALAVMVVAFLVFRWTAERVPVSTAARGPEDDQTAIPVRYAPDTTTAQILRQYVTHSKMLLVGLSNMKPTDGENYDVSVEREKSRQLVYQARYLRNQPLDPRSQKLIGELERVLIELANLKDEGNAPNVDIIRGGMHNENLLFKIRMEEQTFDSPRDSTMSF